MANALETRWHGIIADWYESIGYSNATLNGCYRCQHHHVIGRRGKHNKLHIGGFFVLPLPAEFHDPHSNSVYNVTHRRHNFTGHFGLQSELFKEMIDSMVEFGYDLPFGQDVIDAIMDTKK